MYLPPHPFIPLPARCTSLACTDAGIGVFTPCDPEVFTRLSKLEKVSMIFLLDGCWLSAWGTVARSWSWQIGCSTMAITDQERKEQQMEQRSDLFGFSVVPATVAREI